MIVVPDASALVDYVLQTRRAGDVSGVIRQPGVSLAIPALCDVEFAAGVRRSLRKGDIGVQRAEEALTDFLDLPLRRFLHAMLLPRILELRDNFTAYDATYVALASRIGARLLTTDAKLAAAIDSHPSVGVSLVE